LPAPVLPLATTTSSARLLMLPDAPAGRLIRVGAVRSARGSHRERGTTSRDGGLPGAAHHSLIPGSPRPGATPAGRRRGQA
ncbi:hypothetical protein, partial [Frankia tisae]|uniref:hypothetical protein n=1 Tax=Frankia tisae TaxID=2950104 RepID=UPI0021C1E6ED